MPRRKPPTALLIVPGVLVAGIVAAALLHHFRDWAAPAASTGTLAAASFTAWAAFNASRAAKASSDTARDSRNALALHYRPSVQIVHDAAVRPRKRANYPMGFEVHPQGPGDALVVAVKITGADVRDAHLTWSGPDGVEHPRPLAHPEDEQVRLDGVLIQEVPPGTTGSSTYVPVGIEGPVTLRVKAVDVATAHRWGTTLSLTSGRPNLLAIDLALAPYGQPTRMEPEGEA